MLEHRIQKREFLSTPSARRATLSLLSMAVSGRAFLSTPSARRATAAHPPLLRIHAISIHALREEGDLSIVKTVMVLSQHFYPRPPRGGRRTVVVGALTFFIFLSTPSARRATLRAGAADSASGDFYPRPPRGGRPLDLVTIGADDDISIHALREEGDRPTNLPLILPNRFLSTPSARRATQHVGMQRKRHKDFYPRPPRGGRPWAVLPKLCTGHDFYPRPPRGGRRQAPSSSPYLENFYPRPPRGGRRHLTFSQFTTLVISIHALREEGDRNAQLTSKASLDFYPRPPRGGRPDSCRS